MPAIVDGPASVLFRPLDIQGAAPPHQVDFPGISDGMKAAREHSLSGSCVCWGVPFRVDGALVVRDRVVTVEWKPVRARCLAFMHTADKLPVAPRDRGQSDVFRQWAGLGEHLADYVILYQGGREERTAVRRRRQVGYFGNDFCLQAVPQRRSIPVLPSYEQPGGDYGWKETRAPKHRLDRWMNWLWGWENPHPEEPIAGLRLEPRSGAIVVSAVSAGDCRWTPFRWRPRRKTLLMLPAGALFERDLDEQGLLAQIRMDLGHVISARPRTVYPNAGWEESPPFQVPEIASGEILVEYTSHPDAAFHFADGSILPVTELEEGASAGPKPVGGAAHRLTVVPAAEKRVRLRVVEEETGRPVPVKLHVHGEAGEYLPPIDRDRKPNPEFFEDYGTEHVHRGVHVGTYIPGEAEMRLPLGPVYLEVSKGFEIRPVRRKLEITSDTEEITIPLARVLPWRERGWVSADTHVHFLSPKTAQIEGTCEGVNVVNLLASQWGEMFTNVGDFDGKTTFGSREAGGDGEYLVRVGTENRQHVLGHLSLLGYEGKIISPLCSGGPDESALGDPVEVLLTEWSRRCREQNGLVVMPHIPIYCLESAAAVVEGLIDAVEVVSWGNMYGGINPYSLAHWYRYLNCGYHLPAVGGTDKMAQTTAVGTVRTYARIAPDREFTYQSWKEAVYGGETFVTYGPLLEFRADGRPMGSTIDLPAGGGTLDVSWEAASVTVPLTRAELVVNGETVESLSLEAEGGCGGCSLPVTRSSWAALLVRGHYPGQLEVVAAHCTPVMIRVANSPFYSEADALSILEQIEGSLAYLDSVGTRADDAVYKRMRMVLEAAHRKLHNRMHELGRYHRHTAPRDHESHD